MSENRFRWVAIAIGALALAAGVVALIIAINVSNDDTASQDDVNSSVAQLRQQVVAAGLQLKKGQASQQQKQKAAIGKATQGQAKKNAVTDSRIDAIEANVNKLIATQKTQTQQIGALQASVKQLQVSVDKLTGIVHKLQNR